MLLTTLLSAVADTTKTAEQISLKGFTENMTLREIMDKFMQALTDFIPNLVGALILLFIGLKVIKILGSMLTKLMNRSKADTAVVRFVSTTVKILLRFILILAVIQKIGIETTSFIAMLGAAGLAVGMALQGTLQNFAGGIIILLLKPFKIGDDVEFGGQRGIVKDIQIFNTIIYKLGTNEILIVPNSNISSSILINWSTERERRIEVTFGIAYGEEIEAARKAVLDMAAADGRILPDPAPIIYISQLADSSVNLELRVWVHPADYLDVRSDILEGIYNTLNKKNISIPFPQLTIHMEKEK